MDKKKAQEKNYLSTVVKACIMNIIVNICVTTRFLFCFKCGVKSVVHEGVVFMKTFEETIIAHGAIFSPNIE